MHINIQQIQAIQNHKDTETYKIVKKSYIEHKQYKTIRQKIPTKQYKSNQQKEKKWD